MTTSITSITSISKKHELGQYFTTNIELKDQVNNFILNDPSNILEPSIGQGDLVTYITEKDLMLFLICMRLTKK